MLRFGINDLDLENMDPDERKRFFETKRDFKTKFFNTECRFLDPVVYSKAWNFRWVKNPIGTCFSEKHILTSTLFVGMVVSLEDCLRCKKIFYGCPRGHKYVRWELASYGHRRLYCESCRTSYPESQVYEYIFNCEKEERKRTEKMNQEYDEYLRKTTFIKANQNEEGNDN